MSTHDNLQLTINFFYGLHDVAVVFDNDKTRVVTWEELRNTFSNHMIVEEKAKTPYFNMVEFKTPSETDDLTLYQNDDGSYVNVVRKCADNIKTINALVLDFDGGDTIDDVREKLKSYEHCGYTSFSHLKDDVTEKFRVILPLDVHVTCDEYKSRVEAIVTMFPKVDHASFSLSQAFYIPSCSQANLNKAVSWSNYGRLINLLKDFKASKVYEAPSIIAPINNDDITKMYEVVLMHASQINDRTLWKHVGMAFYAAGLSLQHYKNVSWNDKKTQKECSSDWRGWSNPKRTPIRPGIGLLYNVIKKHFDASFSLTKQKRLDPNELKLVISPKKKINDTSIALNEPLLTFDDSEFEGLRDNKTRTKEMHKHTTSMWNKTTLIFAPEGYGKSYTAVINQIKRGKNILFVSCSGDQTEEKAHNDIQKWVVDPAFIGETLQLHIEVTHIYSRDYNFYKHTGIKAEHKWSADPFDLGVVDKILTIEKLVKRMGCSVEVATELFTVHHTDYIPNKPNFQNDHRNGSSRVVVTTFAMLSNYIISGRYRYMSDKWVIIIDDSGVSDVSLLKEFSPEFMELRRIHEQKREIKHLNPLPPIEIVEVKREDGSTQKYFKKQKHQQLACVFGIEPYHLLRKNKVDGKVVDVIGSEVIKPTIIFTTTEWVTRTLLELYSPSIQIIDLMHKVNAGRLTVFGTSRVRKHSHNDLRTLIQLISETVEIPITRVGNGWHGEGDHINQTNVKGSNTLDKDNIIAKISEPHPQQSIQLMDEINIAGNPTKLNTRYIKFLIMYDQFNQAAGRNCGYRHRDENDVETILLVDISWFDDLVSVCRYKLQPYSTKIPVDSNVARCNKSLTTWNESGSTSSLLVQGVFDMLDNFEIMQQTLKEK